MLSQELEFMLERLDESLRALAESRDRLGEVLGEALADLKQQIDSIECAPEQPDEQGDAGERLAA